MKRNAFTLVELIFVIVIIGVLAAVAIPQYKNLKQNAEVKAMIKTTIDTASSAASAAVNQMDLENNTTSLDNLVSVKGKGWTYNNNVYTYTDPANNTAVASITLSTNPRTVTYSIDCTKFNDTTSQNKCKSDLNTTGTVSNTINY